MTETRDKVGLPETLAFLDLETTGLEPDKHEIIEAAVIRTREGQTVTPEGYHRKYHPLHLETADHEALRINGYTPDAWLAAHYMSRPEAVKLRDLLSDCLIVGQRVDFDWQFLCALWRRYVIEPPRVRRIDVQSIAWWAIGDQLPSLRLADVCTFLGVSNEGAHSALTDAHRCMQVLARLRELEGRQPCAA